MSKEKRRQHDDGAGNVAVPRLPPSDGSTIGDADKTGKTLGG